MLFLSIARKRRAKNVVWANSESLPTKLSYNFDCLNSHSFICVTCGNLKCLLSEASISIIGKSSNVSCSLSVEILRKIKIEKLENISVISAQVLRLYSISAENPLRVKAIKLGSGMIQMIPVASGKAPR